MSLYLKFVDIIDGVPECVLFDVLVLLVDEPISLLESELRPLVPVVVHQSVL